MQAVTCFQCGRSSLIAPNGCVCQHCGEDLQHLLLPETVAQFFQTRAHDSSERGELGAALAETERGLTYADSSELHLLAAILAKQLGRYDRMRQHVAAIAVDDSLRSEAEWLLRSHQDRERALYEAARHARSGPVPASAARHDPADSFLDDLLGGQPSAEEVTKRRYGQMVASVAILVIAGIMVTVGWWWFGPGALGGAQSAENRANPDPALLPVGAMTQAPVAAEQAEVVETATPTRDAVSTTAPTVTASPAVPANLVQSAEETPEIADANPSRVVVVESSIFDIRAYLRQGGYAELAELAIDARLQEETLVLQGFVHLDVQRRQLIDIAQAIPGVAEVEAVDLLLRPLPTYVVEVGDTLWSIVFNIYGNVDRLDEFADYNRGVLPSPDAIAPGMVLQVLPVQ
jgi:nucleoid-associated protein YgaU